MRRSTSASRRWSPICLGLLGCASVCCWWQLRLLGDVREHLSAFYGYFAGTFGLYVTALWLVHRHEQPEATRQAHGLSLGLVLLFALLARLVLLGATPTLSDDIYRYRWDGRVQQAGIDPYAYAPNDPALASLRDADFTRINFPHLRTVYPPVT